MDIPNGSGLFGRVAIVTGGGARGEGIGNGRAGAILLAQEGAKVMVIDRLGSLAERTVEMITQNGGEAAAFAADITENASCQALVQATLERFGRIDVLVNNVGIASRGNVVDEDLATWERVMQVNLTTMFLASKHAIPPMAATGGGAIINISSISALRRGG